MISIHVESGWYSGRGQGRWQAKEWSVSRLWLRWVADRRVVSIQTAVKVGGGRRVVSIQAEIEVGGKKLDGHH